MLEDNKHYFPPYEAVPIVRSDTLARYPEIRTALLELSGKINDGEMRKMNYEVDGEHRDIADVAREFLRLKALD
jgi:osmoprotectant transport system substrate-binding protein